MWNTVKLEEIVNIDIGKTPSRNNPKYWDKEKKNYNVWVSIRDMSALGGLYVDDSREYISNEGAKLFKEVPKNTLIMSFKLSIGKLAITKINLRTNEAIAAFKIKDSTLICNEYLYYYLSSINWDIIAGHDIKVKGKTLNKAKLKEILIVLPSLTEQRRIVAKLDAAFTEIDKIIRTERRKIKDIKKFNSEFISEQINKLSDTNPKKLSDISKLTRGPFGGSITKIMFVEQGYAIYEQKHAIRNNFENIKYFINEVKFNEMKRFELKSGDLLMSCSGTMGKIAIVPKNIKRGIINQALLKITPNEKVVLKEYLKLIISSNYFQKLLVGLSSGAAQVNVPSVKILKNIIMPVPSIETQKKILKKISFIDNLQLENLYKKKEILLNSLKASTIRSLISKDKVAA